MTQEERLKKISEIENVSPLEMSKNLIDMELYDTKSSQVILDEIYEQFESKESIVDEVLIPCMFTVADGIFAGLGVKNKKLIGGASDKGLSPSRFANEVKNFSYEKDLEETYFENEIQSYHHSKQIAEEISPNKDIKYSDTNMRIGSRMDKYKESKTNEKNNLVDEYSGNEIERDSSQTDHIISSKSLFEKQKNNVAINVSELKDGINNKNGSNFAVTYSKLNNYKDKYSAQELIKMKKKGKLPEEFTDEVIDNIKKIEKQAQKSFDKDISKKVGKNLVDKERAGKIYKEVGKQAFGQAKNMAMGDIAMMMVTPITYEACDSFKNGLHEGVGVSTPVEGIKIRVKRVVNYIIEKIKKFKFKITDIIKQLLNSFVNGIINLFLGIYKIIGKAIIKGAKSLIEAFKICFGKDSEKLSKVEKADAILKVVGSLVTGIFGFLIEDFLDNAMPDELSIPFSMIITGILITVVTYHLDKLDLFAVKAEKRHNAVKKIFDERIKDIKEAVELFDEKAVETIRKQQCLHSNISNSINQAFENDDIDLINENIQDLSKFFGVKLEYSTTNEFVDYFDSNKTLVI